METANWLLSEVISLFGTLVWSFFSTGIIYGLAGFILGCMIIMIGRKKRLFKRPNRLWNILAKIHYFYIPILLGLIASIFGFAYGVQKTTNSWIETSSQSIEEYASGYIPQLENIGNQLAESTTKSEETLKASILQGTGLAEYPFAEEFYYWFSRSIFSFVLQEFDYSDDVVGIGQLVASGNLQQLNSTAFSGISDFLQLRLVSNYMSVVYTTLFFFFLPFITLPIIEFIIFFFIRFIYAKQRDLFSRLPSSQP